MKKLLIIIVTLSFNINAADDRQFPDPNQVYIPGKDIGFSKYLTKSLRGTEKVALTFDDGPDVVLTPKVLDALKAYNVKATFFILTQRINESTMPIIKRMIAEGHTLASHHHDHISSDNKTEAIYRAGLKQSIKATTGLMEEENSLAREVYYRFPYGAYGSKKLAYHHMNVMKQVSNELFGDNCINFVFWDIDTADWLETITSAEITQNVMSNLYGGTAYDFEYKNGKYIKVKYNISKPIGGGVVLMHDVHLRSANAVPMILEKFKTKGVEVVPLQEVEEFAYKGKECRLKI